MCMGCWEKYGSQTMDTPKIRKVAEMITEIMRAHMAGGGCHIVLADWNIDDGSIDFCLEYIPGMPVDEDWHTPEDAVQQMACMRAMRELTVPERNSAMYMAERNP